MSSWKLLLDSVVGTSHTHTNQPCQDSADGRILELAEGSVILLVCADGAGSASRSEFGSRFVCDGMIDIIAKALESGLVIEEITRDHVVEWHSSVRSRLEAEADIENTKLREYATTILTAVVGENSAIFSHIGDGAIIYGEGEEYRTPFWPHQGEYANTTYFLTDNGFEQQIAFEVISRKIDEIALITDGLQSLALHYSTKTVHSPFFQPMFSALRNASSAEDLKEPLNKFLISPAVNSRTDDDKTIVLATRR